MVSQETGTVELHVIQHRRRQMLIIGGVSFILFLLLTRSTWPPDSPLHEWFETTAIGLIIIAILGRT